MLVFDLLQLARGSDYGDAGEGSCCHVLHQGEVGWKTFIVVFFDGHGDMISHRLLQRGLHRTRRLGLEQRRRK